MLKQTTRSKFESQFVTAIFVLGMRKEARTLAAPQRWLGSIRLKLLKSDC